MKKGSHKAGNKSKAKTAKKTQKTNATVANAPLKAIPAKQTKAQILAAISTATGLSVKQVKAVFATTSHLVKCHLIKRGSGQFAIPELAIKVVRKTKPATKKRQGTNPFTGETMTIAAKPKRDIVRVRPLKSLKEVVAQ